MAGFPRLSLKSSEEECLEQQRAHPRANPSRQSFQMNLFLTILTPSTNQMFVYIYQWLQLKQLEITNGEQIAAGWIFIVNVSVKGLG